MTDARTYKPPSLTEIPLGTTARFPRANLDVKVGIRVNVLDLVDPWLQLSVFEDCHGHGRTTSESRRQYNTWADVGAHHTFTLRETGLALTPR
jgi:hypothetical protein